MGRKKKAAISRANKAHIMNKILKSRKKEMEEKTISNNDTDSNVLHNPCHDYQLLSEIITVNESSTCTQSPIHGLPGVSVDTCDITGATKEIQDIDSVQLNIESASQSQAKFNLEGRRIVNIYHFFNKIKEIANHGPINCGLESVEFIAERQVGLLSKFTLQCKLCNSKFCIESDSPDDLYVNHSAVAGIIAIGCGHSQLQEFCAALDLPLMTQKTYKQSEDKISTEFEKLSIESMNDAAQKERELAIADGRVDKNQIPVIDVVVDGCWSKRTYKKNYSALSGAAAIIGKRTGNVLFLGVRNKYCCICARAEKKEIKPKSHACYKNYNGPSTGMESDIILEGFKCSIEMHNLIYGRMVSDGDSNTYSKILKNRPYPHITVEKIECRNHVLRNLCNKLVQLQSETKYSLRLRKQLTHKKIMILRRTIRNIINNYKTDSESERRSRIEPFYNDILLAHLHAFGNHSRCKASFCNKSEQCSEAVDQNFFTSTLWSRICLIMSNVASLAPSLIHDLDSNSVERYNSIVAKLVGGKRINYSMKGSYQTRCQAAVVSYNTQKLMSSLYKSCQGSSPTGKMMLLEKKRLQKIAIARKQNRKKNRKLFSKGNDTNYGEKCEKPDMTLEIFEREKLTFLQNLNRGKEEREKIQKDTVLQSSCSEWMEIRRTLLTASNFGRVIKRREDISCANLVKYILYKDSLSHVTSIKHGKENEKKAIEQLKKQENVDVKPCGLFIDEEIPFLGASPDGLIGDDMIVEIKCPTTAFKEGLDEAIKNKKLTFYKINKNGIVNINKSHNWYFQIQGQLHITQRQKCLLGIWHGENKEIKTELIMKDDLFWSSEMKNKLKKFYLDCLLPELVDPRNSRNMKIRDPEYIEKAINEKQAKNKSKCVSKRKINEDKENIPHTDQESKRNKEDQQIKRPKINDKENKHYDTNKDNVYIELNEMQNERGNEEEQLLIDSNKQQEDNISNDEKKELKQREEYNTEDFYLEESTINYEREIGFSEF